MQGWSMRWLRCQESKAARWDCSVGTDRDSGSLVGGQIDIVRYRHQTALTQAYEILSNFGFRSEAMERLLELGQSLRDGLWAVHLVGDVQVAGHNILNPLQTCLKEIDGGMGGDSRGRGSVPHCETGAWRRVYRAEASLRLLKRVYMERQSCRGSASLTLPAMELCWWSKGCQWLGSVVKARLCGRIVAVVAAAEIMTTALTARRLKFPLQALVKDGFSVSPSSSPCDVLCAWDSDCDDKHHSSPGAKPMAML